MFNEQIIVDIYTHGGFYEVLHDRNGTVHVHGDYATWKAASKKARLMCQQLGLRSFQTRRHTSIKVAKCSNQ